MEKLPGEAKDIAYHQNCNKYEYYFSGDRQLFEVLYNLNLHQYLNMTILILLLPGGGVPQRGEVVERKLLLYLPYYLFRILKILSYFQTVTPQCRLPYSENNYVAHHNPVVYYVPHHPIL